MIPILLLVVAYIIARLSQRMHDTLLSPLGVYTLSWLGMFAVYSLGWIPFISVREETWLVLIGSLVAYQLGAFFAFAPKDSRLNTKILPVETWFDGVAMPRYSRLEALVSIAGLVGAVGYFLVIGRLYGLDTLVTNPGLIRGSQSGNEYVSAFFWWKFLFYMNWLAIPLGVARILFQRRRTPLWVYLTLLLHVLVNFALVSRSQMLFVAFMILFVVIAAYHKRLRRWEPVLIGITLMSTVAYFVLAGERLGKTYEYTISQAGAYYGPVALRPFAQFYVYVAGNIPAFQTYMLEHEDRYTYGLFMTLPAAKIVSKLIPLYLPQEVGEFVSIPFRFNTFTYLNVFYSDWGLIGVIIGPLLFGLIANLLYLRTCRNGRVWHVIGSAIIVHASFSSIGTNVLISTPQWEFAIILIVMSKILHKADVRERLFVLPNPK